MAGKIHLLGVGVYHNSSPDPQKSDPQKSPEVPEVPVTSFLNPLHILFEKIFPSNSGDQLRIPPGVHSN